MRHCFTTHLPQAGYDNPHGAGVKELLGHARVATKTIYTSS